VSITRSHWYVVQVQAQREALAAEHLKKQGYEVFSPRRSRTVRHARRLEQRLVGYFPGYFFIKLDLGFDRWHSVNGTIGVVRLIMFGDRPARAPVEFVECLRAMADERGFIASLPEFTPGQRVRVLSGPFADMVGAMERLEGAARVRILMDLIGGGVPMVIAANNLALVS
jgi:transcription elongation factor/antiterminator RfaH